MHSEAASLLSFFEIEHLPPKLAVVSEPFGQLSRELARNLGSTTFQEELNMALRKLLEAKDCAVRAALGTE